MIDAVRQQIQDRLEQIAGEVDRLRKALAALDPRTSSAPARKGPAPQRTQPPRTTTGATKRAPTRRGASRSNGRAASGATRAAVLATLAGGDAMTATEVATKADIARPTVSTTLSRLAKSGEVEKAERGYRLAAGASRPPK